MYESITLSVHPSVLDEESLSPCLIIYCGLIEPDTLFLLQLAIARSRVVGVDFPVLK